jgi:hypothetical protein
MGWKIYFWIFLALNLWSYSDELLGNFSTRDIVSIPLTAIHLIGFFGYAFKKNLFNKDFWKVSFFIVVAWDMFWIVREIILVFLSTIEIIESGISDFGPVFRIILIAFVFFIFLPSYIALFLYAFRSKELWNKAAF